MSTKKHKVTFEPRPKTLDSLSTTGFFDTSKIKNVQPTSVIFSKKSQKEDKKRIKQNPTKLSSKNYVNSNGVPTGQNLGNISKLQKKNFGYSKKNHQNYLNKPVLPLPKDYDIKKVPAKELDSYLSRKILDYCKSKLEKISKNTVKKIVRKKYINKNRKIMRSVKRHRNPWGQTRKNFNKFKKRVRRFKFQKRYKINSKMKFMKNNYFRNYESLFSNIMWIKKGFRKMYGNMSKHDSVIFHKKIETSLQRKNNMFENFFGEVECILPVALYRLRLAPGIKTAKEYVRHGRVKVNSKLVTFINYKLQPHDVISLHHILKKCYRRRFMKSLSNRQKKRFRLQVLRDRARQRILRRKNSRSKYKIKLRVKQNRKKKFRQSAKITSHRPRYYEFSKKLRRAVLLYKPKFYELHYNRYRFSFRMYLVLLNNFRYIKY